MDSKTIESLKTRPKATKPPTEARVGDLVKTFMEQVVSRKKSLIDPVRLAWLEVAPEGLQAHCSIKGIEAGQLTVGVDSSVYLFEAQLCSPELLEELKTRCPRARLSKLKFVLA